MTNKFEMSMMGELKFFLGFEVRQLRGGTFINQAKYIQVMLKKFNMDSGVKGSKTPMSTKVTLDLDPNGKEVDKKLYRSMIGSFIPQLLAFGTRRDQASSLLGTRIPIGRETKWIGNELLGLDNFLIGPWLVGLPRSKIVYLSPPPKPSTCSRRVVVLNSFGCGKR
jgi:hypothetical protein